MDDEGYVPLDVIAGFNRVRMLTTDKNVLKEVCCRVGILLFPMRHALFF